MSSVYGCYEENNKGSLYDVRERQTDRGPRDLSTLQGEPVNVMSSVYGCYEEKNKGRM